MSKSTLPAAALLLACAASTAPAAISVNVFPKVTAAYAVNPDGTVGSPVPIPDTRDYHFFPYDPYSEGTPAGPTFYEVHYYVTVTGADSTHSLGGIAFGINGITRTPTYHPNSLGSGHPAAPTQGLVPAPGGVNTDDFSDANSNPLSLSGNTYGAGIYDALLPDGSGGYTAEGFVVSPAAQAAFTGAAGDNNQFDLEAMAFSLNSGKATSTQRTVGQNAPFDLGFVRVYWNQTVGGSSSAILNMNNIGDAIDPNIQYAVDTFPSSNPAAAGTLSNAQLVADTSFVDLSNLPEPASLTLLALGILPLLARRRTR